MTKVLVKVCFQCKESKSSDQFWEDRRNKDGLGPYCKPCQLSRQRDRRWRAGPEERAKRRAYERTYYHSRKGEAPYQDQRQRLRLWGRYKITPEEVAAIFERQHGKCAICGSENPGGRGNSFHIDHDHKTGKVRGLLCARCNHQLGTIENEEWMTRALAYLGEM